MSWRADQSGLPDDMAVVDGDHTVDLPKQVAWWMLALPSPSLIAIGTRRADFLASPDPVGSEPAQWHRHAVD